MAEKCHGDNEYNRSTYHKPEAYIDMSGIYYDRRKHAPLEEFMRQITAKGLTYAEAQMMETKMKIGMRVR